MGEKIRSFCITRNAFLDYLLEKITLDQHFTERCGRLYHVISTYLMVFITYLEKAPVLAFTSSHPSHLEKMHLIVTQGDENFNI